MTSEVFAPRGGCLLALVLALCPTSARALAPSDGSPVSPSPGSPLATGSPVPGSPPTAGAPPPAEVSEEERRIIEESLGADAEGGDEPPPAAAPAAPASMNPDISVVLDAAAAYFSDEPAQTGGHDPSATGFNLQQLELHLAAAVDPFLRFESNVVFGLFGVEVEEAYATTLALPARLQARAGQFLTRFGRLNTMHPHAWSFADQPLVLGKLLGSEGSRGLGVEASWLAPLPWYLEVVASSTGAAGECCARSFFGAEDLGVDSFGDLLYTLAVKQFFPLGRDLSLLWGVSTQLGPSSTGRGNRTDLFGTDLYLRFRPVGSTAREALSLQVEVLARRRQVPGELLVDYGGYAQLVWELARRWQTGGRFEWVSGVEGDPLDPGWRAARDRAAAQLTFLPSHFSRIRLQAQRDTPPWRERPVWGLFAALEVVVGAHGAHPF